MSPPRPRSLRRAPPLGLAALLATVAACSSDAPMCGPPAGATAASMVTAVGGGVTLAFHQLRARRNNDCPAPDAPAGVVSVTISGVQVGGTAPLTLCVPRPDLLRGARQIGVELELIDMSAVVDACSYRLALPIAATGAVTATGVCDDGRAPAGFGLDFDVQAAVERTCGQTRDTLQMTLTGLVPVVPSDS
ncbi:MAG: hypothetical protein R3B48_20790 [Kofleriaceae bacterium]